MIALCSHPPRVTINLLHKYFPRKHVKSQEAAYHRIGIPSTSLGSSFARILIKGDRSLLSPFFSCSTLRGCLVICGKYYKFITSPECDSSPPTTTWGRGVSRTHFDFIHFLYAPHVRIIIMTCTEEILHIMSQWLGETMVDKRQLIARY